MFLLSIYKIIYILTAATGFILAVVILHKSGRDRFSYLYSLVNLSVFVWSIGRYASLLAENPSQALFWIHFLYFGSILIYVFFLHTILVFLGLELKRWKILRIFYINAFFLVFVNIFDIFTGSSLLIRDVIPKLFFPYYEVPGILYAFQLLANIVIPTWTFAELLLAYKNNEFSDVKRGQLKYILVSSIFGFIGGGTILLLVYDIPIQPFGLPFVALQFITITYAMVKHRLFNVKVIAAQLFVFMLWAFIFARGYISTTIDDKISNWGLLFISVIIGILLIKSVVNEVEQREKIEKLAGELEKANEKLTDLDRQKSEFVSIASHQLRSPLTAIKGYSSMLLEGSFGKLSKKVNGAVHTISDSSESLVRVIDNFLNLSRIEQGRMAYDPTPTDISLLTKSMVEQLLPNAMNKGLKISFHAPDKGDFTRNIDKNKTQQVILNMIDNSIKYTPKGSIKVSIDHTVEGKIIITVADTGVGMSPATIAKLFQKFSRADGASKVNAGGTGLGMYLANQIMQAQGGAVRAESDGEGKGSRFIIEFSQIDQPLQTIVPPAQTV